MEDSLVAPSEGPEVGPATCMERFASCWRSVTEMAQVAGVMSGVTVVTGSIGPTEMMLCRPDLRDKHPRWFKVDADSGTIEWGKNKVGDSLTTPYKGPFTVLAVQEREGGVLELTTTCCSTGGSGETVLVKPNRVTDEYAAWLKFCSGVALKNKGSEMKENVTAKVTEYTGTMGPTKMMFCKPETLKAKHQRSIRVNCDTCTVEWGEKWVGEGADAVRKAGKGPFVLTGVREVQRAVKSNDPGGTGILELTTSGVSAFIKPGNAQRADGALAGGSVLNMVYCLPCPIRAGRGV